MKSLIRFLIRRIPRPVLIRFSYLFSWVFRFWYRGNNVECPVCGNTFRSFLPYGVKVRENALCPACLSLERHRLLWLYLENETGFFSDMMKVLHIAPEQSFLKRFRALKNLDYTTADLESPLADLHFDLHEIPFDNNQFDLFMCNHVLEHVEDDKRVLGEVFRVLRPGGKAIMQVPLDYEREVTYENPEITDPGEREKHFGQKDHLRVYGLDFPERLKKAGFDVMEVPYPAQLGPAKIRRYSLPEEEIIYISVKPKI